MTAQPPVVCLVARQARAVDAALLTRAHADGLTILHVAHRIRLRVLQRDERHHHVCFGSGGHVLVLGHHVLKQRLVDFEVVATLLEGDAEHVFALNLSGHVRRVDAHHVVLAALLGGQNRKRLVGVARRYDAVGHFLFQIACHVCVARFGKRHPVAVRAQTIGTARADVSAGNRAQITLVFHEVHLTIDLVKRMAHRSPRRRHVLEGCRSRKPRGARQLAHQLPRVQCIEKVDIARLAVQHLDRQIGSVPHEDARGLLVRVAAVFQFQLVHGFALLNRRGSCCRC